MGHSAISIRRDIKQLWIDVDDLNLDSQYLQGLVRARHKAGDIQHGGVGK